jgi:acylphosphatase
MELARHYRIRGRVQGVGYRYFAQRTALRLGVRGWVRNLRDGDVEVHAEAAVTALQSFRSELARGPAHSEVTEVIEESREPTDRYTSFEIRG